MTFVYICIIILTLLFFVTVFLKATLHLKYEIVGIDTLTSYLNISILNFDIFKKVNSDTLANILTVYIRNNKKKEKDIDIDIQDTKKIFNMLINEIAKEKISLHVQVGVKDSILPIYIVPTLSTAFSMYLVNNIKKKYIKNIKYNILPNYFHTYILIDAIIKFNLLAFIKVFYLKKKYKEGKNGKSSN